MPNTHLESLGVRRTPGMRTIRGIVVHCSATRPSMDIGAAEIRAWHTDPPPKGNGWADIGYHHVIRRNGIIEMGRPIEQVGAHVAGHNAGTVGICLVGGVDDLGHPVNNFGPSQFEALAVLIDAGQALAHDLAHGPAWPVPWVKGHRDLFAGKACPSFDVARWIAAGMPAEWAGQP